MNYKLTIELVPESSWYNNVRSNVTKNEWDKIRKKSYQYAGDKCEICKDTGKNQGYRHNVECHEIWHYDDINREQKLIGLISLCPLCHKVKHPGLASMKGQTELVIKQLCKVNNISRTEAVNYLHNAFDIFDERSKYKYSLDISYLKEYLKDETFDDLF